MKYWISISLLWLLFACEQPGNQNPKPIPPPTAAPLTLPSGTFHSVQDEPVPNPLEKTKPDSDLKNVSQSTQQTISAAKVLRNLNGEFFSADPQAHLIYKIANGQQTIFAGSGQPGSKDGKGLKAQFFTPTLIGIDGQDNLFVKDLQTQHLRKIAPDGMVTTLTNTEAENLPSDTTIQKASNTNSDQNLPLFSGACQEWFCPQSFGDLWMGQCCDKNGDGQFELPECSGKTPFNGYLFPEQCPILPEPSVLPPVLGGCTTYFCSEDNERTETGQCCDTNLNGSYEPEECTGKTPNNGFPENAERCAL